MTRIFDNIKLPLGPHLQETLGESYRMDVAVGYFNLRGWRLFDQQINDMNQVGAEPLARVLIGMILNTDQADALNLLQKELDGNYGNQDLVDNQTALQRRNALIADLRAQLSRGLPNETDRKTLKNLRDQVENGLVQVKVFTRRPLHGKAYIFHRETQNGPIVGFVGSSNLTSAGMQANYELNVDVLDSAASSDLATWFEERWNDVFSLTITAELLELIEDSWVVPAKPYDVYLKLCYELSRDVREGKDEYSIEGPINDVLLDFQREAVRTLVKRIVKRGGTMLGDVVGLGKTLTAIAVAAVMRDEYFHSTLVVCPKNLASMWAEHLHTYQIHGKVIPYSMAAKILPSAEKYRFVIVDESHTMRNSERKDYVELHQYIREWECKILLLTATPYNVGFSDVANQLRLWIDTDSDLGLQPSAALAKDPSIADKVDGKISTLAAFLKSDEPEDWQRLMSEHMVRRTRSFVKNMAINSGNVDELGPFLKFADGSRFHFPKRIPKPITHAFALGDPAKLMVTDTTLDAINGLSLPRYDLANYLNKETVLSDEEKTYVSDWRRSRGQVKGFVRTNFYKRLSSCGYSFMISLERHVARNELFLYAISNGLQVPTGTILDQMFAPLDNDEDYEEADGRPGELQIQYKGLRDGSSAGINWVRSELFTAEFKAQVEKDTKSLKALLASYGTWTIETDSKLIALRDLLIGKHKEDKVLIFTEYRDTAEYLGNALMKLGLTEVEVASGNSANPTDLARRFSPNSNNYLGTTTEPDGTVPIHVLIATDVLSEGQNLQDAHVVVNYDLPWAIIKLIQRAGRVDRIGQKSSEVLLYSMFHEDVENVLNLRSRIKQRLSDNAKTFGSDEQFFGGDGEVKLINNAFNGEELEEGEDKIGVDAASLAYEAWLEAIRQDPTVEIRIPGLSDLLHSTKSGPAPEGFESGVGTFVRTQRGFAAHGCASPNGRPKLLTGQEALRYFKCSLETPALPDRNDCDELLNSLVTGDGAPLSITNVTYSALRGTRKRVWDLLTQTLHETVELNSALDLIHQYPLTDGAERVLRRELRTGKIEEVTAALLRLSSQERLVVSGKENDSIRIVCSIGIE